MVGMIEAINLSKSYGPVSALSMASICVKSSEIVGLVGDNGAGKSTLVKALSGMVQPDRGEILFGGKPWTFAGPHEARLNGIETVHQDLGLCDNLSIYQNVFLGREHVRKLGPLSILDKRRMVREAQLLLGESRVALGSVKSHAGLLSGGQRQVVAISRAMKWDAKVVLLDEPTAALSVDAAEGVLEGIERLRNAGSAILMISHDIPHVLRMCSRVIVMRHGKTIAEVEASSTSAEYLVALMTGVATGQEVQRSDS